MLKADRVDGAAAAVVDYLKRWPEQPQAETVVAKVLADQTLAGHAEVAAAIEQWTLVSGTPQKWSLETVADALVRCGHQLPAARFDFLLQRLGEGDPSGRHTAEVLAGLTAADRPSVAEQVATFFIAEQHEHSQPMAMESACRWAGRTERWAMLALAAEAASPPTPSPRRAPHVDRLFAESLTRTGRKTLALAWWCHVVDHHQAGDFGTLIRCAEAAVADGTIAAARQRLDAVEVAIESADGEEQSGAGMRQVLLDLLEADLAVRQIEFDQARSGYEAVVRSPAATAALLGRAQWMIGETYFLQRNFHAAIEAYRKVEGLDPHGPYAAAALIQAGKCFEQLGRTQQAGVCYGTLISRFADSPHAGEARRRMAALSNGGAAGTGDSPSSNPSRLRR
jgi:tetratricopeptide (TPR) repeat protein